MFLPTQAAAKQASVQAERFGMGEEVECSGQKAGAGIALPRGEFCFTSGCSASEGLCSSACKALGPICAESIGRTHSEGLETTLWEWDQTAPC